MTFKTLTIKKDVYDRLLTMKQKDESFSELFDRLSRKNVDALKKIRGSLKIKDKDKMIEEIYEKRKEKRAW